MTEKPFLITENYLLKIMKILFDREWDIEVHNLSYQMALQVKR